MKKKQHAFSRFQSTVPSSTKTPKSIVDAVADIKKKEDNTGDYMTSKNNFNKIKNNNEFLSTKIISDAVKKK